MSDTEAIKVETLFSEAWFDGGLCKQANELWNNRTNSGEVFRDVMVLAFAAGARAFSAMPLCDHGVAVWGIEICEACAQSTEVAVAGLEAEKEEAVVSQDFELVASLRDRIATLKAGPGEFPGYNRPFGEAVPELLVEDLKAEHEAMRLSLLQVLIKAGVIDKDSMRAPWDTVTLLRFTGLWLSDAMPWVKQGATHQVLTEAIRRLERRSAHHDRSAREQAKLSADARISNQVIKDLVARVDRLEEQHGVSE